MGAVLSIMLPHLVLGAAGFFLMGKVGIVAGCSIPLVLEVGHAVADEVGHQLGIHDVGHLVRERLHWDVVDIRIRSYSLNFCGLLNHFFDFLRRLLCPLAFSFSGQMTHETVVFKIRDQQGDCATKEAYLLLCKCHNGDIIVDTFDTVEQVDLIAKPRVFGCPKDGCLGRWTDSHGFQVRDVLEKVQSLPPAYRMVTDNCHHFVKDVWNWHLNARLAVTSDYFLSKPDDSRKHKFKEIKWPRSGCLRRKNHAIAIKKQKHGLSQSLLEAPSRYQPSGSESILSCSSSSCQDGE